MGVERGYPNTNSVLDDAEALNYRAGHDLIAGETVVRYHILSTGEL